LEGSFDDALNRASGVKVPSTGTTTTLLLRRGGRIRELEPEPAAGGEFGLRVLDDDVAVLKGLLLLKLGVLVVPLALVPELPLPLPLPVPVLGLLMKLCGVVVVLAFGLVEE
jgi:hypothetical protein